MDSLGWCQSLFRFRHGLNPTDGLVGCQIEVGQLLDREYTRTNVFKHFLGMARI